MSDKPITSPIHVPRDVKTRWVRQSQALGMTLSDWVQQAVERSTDLEATLCQRYYNAIQQAERPANRTAAEPCRRCGSVVLVADGPGCWQCAQCGLVA